jgi:hypothetical protein
MRWSTAHRETSAPIGMGGVGPWDWWLAPAGAFLVGQVAAAGGGQVPAVLASLAQAGVGLAGPADQQLGGRLAAVDAAAEGVLDQGVAEQPGLDGLRGRSPGSDTAPESCWRGRSRCGGSGDRPGSRGSVAGSWLLVLGADGAQQLVGAPFADPGRGRLQVRIRLGQGGRGVRRTDCALDGLRLGGGVEADPGLAGQPGDPLWPQHCRELAKHAWQAPGRHHRHTLHDDLSPGHLGAVDGHDRDHR